MELYAYNFISRGKKRSIPRVEVDRARYRNGSRWDLTIADSRGSFGDIDLQQEEDDNFRGTLAFTSSFKESISLRFIIQFSFFPSR
jgi:hypothetical protein